MWAETAPRAADGTELPRRTDRGLPEYNDREESDIYLLSGWEDLVPVLREGDDGVLREGDDGASPYEEFKRDGHRRASSKRSHGTLERSVDPAFERIAASVAIRFHGGGAATEVMASRRPGRRSCAGIALVGLERQSGLGYLLSAGSA